MSAHVPRFSMNGDGKHRPTDQNDRKRQVIEDLTGRFKELNSLWLDAEAGLKKFPLPVDAIFKYSTQYSYPAEAAGDESRSYLGFVKWGSGWRICHGTDWDQEPEVGVDWKPITECSLDLRLQMIRHIADLRGEVLRAAEACVPKLDQAISGFRDALSGW